MKTYSIVILLIITLLSSGCKKEQKTREAGIKMQEFVMAISQKAKSVDSDFIIIPQNGVEVIFNDLNPENELNHAFLNAIDGYGIEELYYDGDFKPDQYKLDMLHKLAPYKPVMIAEYISDNQSIPDAVQRNAAEGFLCFPRSNDNYHYKDIPPVPANENASPIHQLNDAKNYLYLINSDNYASKTSFLNSIATTNYDVVILDLFFENEPFTTQELELIRTKSNGAKRLLICYMNIGSAEKFRYYWQSKWKLHNPSWIKKKYKGYPDEFWVQYWNSEWQEIIYGKPDSYLSKVMNAGFDGVYLDNIEAFYTLYHNK